MSPGLRKDLNNELRAIRFPRLFLVRSACVLSEDPILPPGFRRPPPRYRDGRRQYVAGDGRCAAMPRSIKRSFGGFR